MYVIVVVVFFFICNMPDIKLRRGWMQPADVRVGVSDL